MTAGAGPGRPPPAASEPVRDSAFETNALERSLGIDVPPRWSGWRRRALVLVALAGCLTLFAMARWLASTPQIDAQWSTGPGGALVLQSSPLPALRPLQGQVVLAITAAGGPALPADALLLHHSPRWQVDDALRLHQQAAQQKLVDWLAAGPVQLRFASGETAAVGATPRGYGGLGLLFWPLAGLALALMLFAAAVLLAHAQASNLLYLTMALCQAGNLLFIAVETARGLGLPAGVPGLGLDLRLALDACTGAAAVHAFALHPRRLPKATLIAAAGWTLAAAGLLLAHFAVFGATWWWAQGLCLALGLLALAVVDHSQRLEPNPYARVMRRFCVIALATLALVTTAVAVAARMPGIAPGVAAAAAVTWYLFLASLLLLTPFLSRSRRLLREFALLAGIATVAASVDLLFAAWFALGPFTSLTLAVGIALSVYAGARHVATGDLLGSRLPSAERIFEHIYRAARDVRARPARYHTVMGQLLRNLFDPLEMRRVDRAPRGSRVIGGGSVLVVPVRRGDDEAAPAMALVLRFARRGERLFTLEDARLADRVVEQLRRAVAYDKAVERGRSEERLRIAQDLHDDIGARLLTLMYQAPTPEMENYIRHTLQDLKTLTRGLAASEHRLSHAAAEWKADLTQRLSAAQADLGWSLSFDRDLQLSVVQWSAVTRVLRELVSNALFHGHATRVDVRLSIEGPQLALTVADDGGGRAPQAWAHGLGLGGVRKRVKLMGGEVAWRENSPRGIVCEVKVGAFAAAE
jgi:signal transduction histidine kinase